MPASSPTRVCAAPRTYGYATLDAAKYCLQLIKILGDGTHRWGGFLLGCAALPYPPTATVRRITGMTARAVVDALKYSGPRR